MIEKNEKAVKSENDTKSYGLGIRHLQMACMTLNLTSLIIARASMGIAVLAMSEVNEKNDKSVQVFDWDKHTQSLILSSFFWGYLIMQIPSGILAKRFGGKSVQLVALTSNMAICLLVPTSAAWGGWMLVCACRASMGLAQACMFSSTHTLLGQWLPDNERTSYTGIVYGGVQIGTIIAMPLSGFLADSFMGWKLIFYVVAGILFVNAIIWYALAANSPREHRMISAEERMYIEAGLNVPEGKRPPTPWRYILRSKGIWAVMGPHFGFALSFVLLFVDMPTYLEKGLHISLKNSALLSALPYVGMWAGSILAGFISEQICNRKLINITLSRKIFQSISSFGTASGLLLLSFLGPEDKTLAVVGLVASLTCNGFSTPGFLVTELDLSPNYAGVIFSVLNCIVNVGIVGMPLVTSYILQNDATDLSRWKIVFLVMSSICAASNVIFLLFGTAERQEWDDPNFLRKLQGNIEESQPVLKQVEKVEKEESEEK